jgi:hypothetical protein
MSNARLYTFWASLTEGLRTGQPQSEVKTGGDFFERLYAELGFDFTGADCRGWMADAGFSESYVEHLADPDSMVVGIR